MTSTNMNDESGSAQAVPVGGEQGAIEVGATPAVTSARPSRWWKPSGDTYDQGDVLDRYTTIYTVDIVSTDTQGLKASFNPYYLWSQNAIVWDRIRPYSWFRGDLELLIMFTVGGMAKGLYVMSALCEAGAPQTSVGDVRRINAQGVNNWRASVQMDSVLLDCSISNSGTMTLPFVNNTEYMPVQDRTQFQLYPPWMVELYCIDPLQPTVVSVPVNGNVRILARVKPGYELVGKTYFQSKNVKPSASLAGMGQHMTDLGNSVPLIKPFTSVASAGLALLSDVAGVFGFSRTAAPSATSPYVHRLFTSMSTTDTEDTSEIVALSVANAVSIDPGLSYGDIVDPMAIETLCNRWHIHDTYQIDRTTPINAGIINLRVTPFMYKLVPSSTGRIYSPAGYVGLPFKYWRADAEYGLYIVSNGSVRGKVQVFWIPDYAPGVDSVTNRYVNEIIDLQGSSFHTFKVGFNQEEPACRNVSSGTDSNLVNAGTASNGAFRLKLFQNLEIPNDTGYITIVLMVRWTNVKFWGMHRQIESVNNAGTAGYQDDWSEIYFQSGVMLSQDIPQQEHELTPFGDYPTADILSGENIESVRGLMQLPTYLGVWKYNNTGTFLKSAAWLSPIMVPPVDQTAVDLYTERLTNDQTDQQGKTPFSWGGYYGPIFSGIKGSIRVKVLNPEETQKSRVIATNGYAGVITQLLNAYIQTYQQQDVQSVTDEIGAEFTFPYYDLLTYRYPNAFYLFSESYVGWGAFPVLGQPSRANGTALASYSYDVFKSYGPDLSVNRFRRIPIIYGLTAPT